MKNLRLVVKYIKAYKSRSIAIMISMIFSIGLIVGVGTLRETNNDIELQSMKHKTGPYQVVFDDVNKNQFEKLRLNKNIKHLGIQYLYNVTASQEKQSISIIGANNDYILSNSKLLFGRLPEKDNEVVAEEWILRALGVDLEPNQEINLKVENGANRYKEETFKLVGILNDISSNKLYGRKNIFINQNIMNSAKLSISVEFKNGVDIYSEINNICDKIGISKDNINIKDDMIELENIKNSTNLDDISFIVAISLVCGFVIYGIFNISIHSRIREYSLLRSIGFNNFNIFKLVLEELLLMYLISLPIGIFLGAIGAGLFNRMSNDIDINIILHGEIVKFKIIFPIFVILISTLFIGVLVLLISYLLYRKIKKISVIDGIKKNFKTNNFKRNIISVTKLRKFMKTYAALAFKNILRNKKTFIIIISSLSICGIIFILSTYKLTILDKSTDLSNWQMYSNSDIQIGAYKKDKSKGISEEFKDEIEKIEGVKNLETTKLIPSKMILNEEDITNKEYFENLNKSVNDMYLNSYLAKDKNTSELLLKNTFRGYNDFALEKLKDYVIGGNIDIEKMKKEGLAVLCIPQTNEDSFSALPYGKSVLGIKPGDKITIKFRKNKILDDKYYKLEDKDEEYIYKTFTIGSIVSYNYMFDGAERTGPSSNIIVSENVFENATGVQDFYYINVNMKEGYNDKVLEKEISKVTSKGDNITPRNIIKEKETIKAINERSKINSIGITLIIFTIVIINIINNINYNIVSRVNEFGMLRAVGLNEINLKKMIVLEGLFYWITSSIIIIIISILLEIGLYKLLNISLMGIKFNINFIDYIIVILINLSLIILVSYFNANKIKKTSIVDNISDLN